MVQIAIAPSGANRFSVGDSRKFQEQTAGFPLKRCVIETGPVDRKYWPASASAATARGGRFRRRQATTRRNLELCKDGYSASRTKADPKSRSAAFSRAPTIANALANARNSES